MSPNSKADRPGEYEMIARYFAPLAHEGAFNLKDDAALLSLAQDRQLVITHDSLLEGIHFLPDDPRDTVAKKALRVNLSDLFAKGAEPHSYSLSLGLPDEWDERDIELFAKGLAEDQEHFDTRLTGGDTYRSPHGLCIGIAMFGSVPTDGYVSRLTAEPGEVIAVSGTIGNGALGLDVRQGRLDLVAEANDWLADRYRIPQPLPAYAAIVREFASASMDISDGLLGDLAKLCSASGLGATVERTALPLSEASKSAIDMDPKLWERVLGGGDDYEILFTVPSDRFELCQEAARAIDATITAIGKTHAGPAGEVTLQLDGKPVPVSASSWSHF